MLHPSPTHLKHRKRQVSAAGARRRHHQSGAPRAALPLPLLLRRCCSRARGAGGIVMCWRRGQVAAWRGHVAVWRLGMRGRRSRAAPRGLHVPLQLPLLLLQLPLLLLQLPAVRVHSLQVPPQLLIVLLQRRKLRHKWWLRLLRRAFGREPRLGRRRSAARPERRNAVLCRHGRGRPVAGGHLARRDAAVVFGAAATAALLLASQHRQELALDRRQLGRRGSTRLPRRIELPQQRRHEALLPLGV